MSDFMQVLQEVVKSGVMVKKGDQLAEFDRQNMLNRLDDLQASLIQAEASFRNLQAELEVDKKIHEQDIAEALAALDKAKLDLKTAPVRSEIDTTRLKLAHEEAEARHRQLLSEVRFKDISHKAQLKNSEIELQQARNELKRAQANADRMVVRAPIDGMAVMQNIFQGGELRAVQQGDQLFPGQLFMQVVDPASMVINAAVNQVDVERMRVGARARVRFDAYPDLELPARVTAIGAITRAGGQRASFFKEVPVFLKLERMDPRVIPDLSVSADIVLASEDQVAVAPLAAVFRENGGPEPFVWIRSGANFEKRPVELGLTSNIDVAIRKGLRAGDVVALEPPRKKQGS
ncbi:MAG TPA: hypothetical protein DEH78_02970 [Solibacterales bacterium]|nr:hypothetical protein [Bryobacterales bacterium]